jgi:hypothetical protein
MCSCNNSGGLCGGNSNTLRLLRNRTVTLYNTVKIPEKKTEYKELIDELDFMLASIKSECPTQEKIILITNYLDSEQSNRNQFK